MQTMRELNRFIGMLRTARSEEDLSAILTEYTCWLGLEYFAMGHHVDLARPPRDAIRATNYDPSWIAQVAEHRYFIDDPIHAYSMKTVDGFRWDEIVPSCLTLRQQLILDRARHHGLVVGYTVPVFLPGEYSGTCSFAGRSFDLLRPYALEMSGVIACAAFEIARLIMHHKDGRLRPAVPRLTIRETEALILIGRGKTDDDIGAIMGVKRTTAHGYVEAVRQAYGNIPRPSLMLRALFDSQFSFADAFRR